MTNATNTPAPYMTKAEIARRLGVSRAMIWKMVKAGKFPAGHILNKWECTEHALCIRLATFGNSFAIPNVRKHQCNAQVSHCHDD